MITQLQDYKLVTPAGKIDGGILPARDVAADGSAHALRTEDACFLSEAGRRINAYRFSTSGVPFNQGEPSLVLDRGPFVGAINGIHEGAVAQSALLSSDVRTWPNAPVLRSGGNVQSGQGWRYIPNIVSYGTTGVANLWDGCLTSATASAAKDFVASTVDYFSFGEKALWNDELRKVYHDLDRVKGVVATGDAIFTSGSTYRKREWRHDGTLATDRTYDYVPSSSAISRVFIAYRDSDSFNYPIQYDYSWTATGVQNPAAQSGRLAALRGMPTSCWALWTVTSTMRSLSNSGYLAQKVDAYLVDASITQAGNLLLGVSVTTSELLRLCVLAHGNDAYPFYDYVWTMPDHRREEISAAYVGVMFYDSGVDFSALGWTWPTAN